MSEFKRYTESCMEGGGVVESKDGEFVDYSTYAAAQSELAALREDFTRQLQDLKRERQKAWDARDAAEQRNAQLTGLLRDTKTVLGNELSYELFQRINEHMKRIDAALKPTESGASE